MADIAPLKGLIYNLDKVDGQGRLFAPPYDVVTAEEQAGFHAAHPYNVMHLILGASRPEDGHEYAWHARAGEAFRAWQREGVLTRHEKPAIYYVETDYTDPVAKKRKTRRGVICLLKLEDFGKTAKVRPHERTFSAHKAERLDLMINTGANLSQIFAVYPDQERETHSLVQPGVKGEPIFDFVDHDGNGQRLWPIFDPAVIAGMQGFMKEKTIYIADGHHRYETSLNYRRYQAERGVEIGPDSPLNYTMVYLCAISDPGLCILPAHRLICRGLETTAPALRQALSKHFELTAFAFDQAGEPAARQAFLERMREEGRTRNAIGLYSRLERAYLLLVPPNGISEGTALDTWPPEIKRLDTVVLTGLVLQETLGFSETDLDNPKTITYTSRVGEAIRQVDAGQAQMACILNPTRMEHVQDVAEAGLVMPRKSTYFFPKVITGLVFNKIME